MTMWRVMGAVAWAPLMPGIVSAQCLLRGIGGAGVGAGVDAVLVYSGCEERVVHGIVVWRPSSERAVAPEGWRVDSLTIQRWVDAVDRRRRDPASSGYRYGGGSGEDGFLTVAASRSEARVDLLWTGPGVEFEAVGSFPMSTSLDTITMAVLKRPHRGAPPTLMEVTRVRRPGDWDVEETKPVPRAEEAIADLQAEPERLRQQLQRLLLSWAATREILGGS